MASVESTATVTGLQNVRRVSWALAGGDTGKRVSLAGFPDRTVQVTATFGSATLRGSNLADPSDATAGDWFNLTDPQGNALTFTAAGGELIAENPLWISPITTGGSAYVITIVAAE